jgi:ubiquinone/menaquinone biosynthesis C-methylase UbiE
VHDGLPRLVDDAQIRGVDWVMRAVYDAGACLHDPGVRVLLPLLQFSGAAALRDGYMPRLELDALRRGGARRPPRVLEVGVGTGANLPLLERDLPRGLDVELWGCDLSEGMLAQCRRRLTGHTGRRLRLLVADAHALPFPDHSFDRVFHVGGIAGYRDPARGLSEMARVARPGTPIVVVDEQLDPRRRHGLYHRLMFRALTFYTPEAVCPRAELPAAATDVLEEQISRFYYCLRFRVPAPRRVRGAA